jgi:hypothetical protein
MSRWLAPPGSVSRTVPPSAHHTDGTDRATQDTMTATNRKARHYRVEAHGAATLVMFGGVTTAENPFRPEPLLTREGAWSSVKHLVAEGAKQGYHTIKVFRDGALCLTLWRQDAGGYMDPKTCKVYS